MALAPTCVRCGGAIFETKVMEPRGSNYKLVSLNCAMCGGVAGVLDYMNIGAKVLDVEKDLAELSKTVGRLEGHLSQLTTQLNQILQRIQATGGKGGVA